MPEAWFASSENLSSVFKSLGMLPRPAGHERSLDGRMNEKEANLQLTADLRALAQSLAGYRAPFGASIGVWLFYVQHQFEDTFWTP